MISTRSSCHDFGSDFFAAGFVLLMHGDFLWWKFGAVELGELLKVGFLWSMLFFSTSFRKLGIQLPQPFEDSFPRLSRQAVQRVSGGTKKFCQEMSAEVPSGKRLHHYGKSPLLMGHTHYKWPFSSSQVLLVYHREGGRKRKQEKAMSQRSAHPGAGPKLQRWYGSSGSSRRCGTRWRLGWRRQGEWKPLDGLAPKWRCPTMAGYNG